MDNTSGTNPFIDKLLLDPFEFLKAEQCHTATQYDAPFMIVSTKKKRSKADNPFSDMYINSSLLTYSHLTMLMPENVKVVVGEYTFALSPHLKLGVSARDGVDVFVGCNHNGGLVAAKRCVRRAPLSLPQPLGPVNKSNLVRLLEISTLDQHSFVMITELCECNIRTFIASDVFKEGGSQLKKRMCTEFLSGLNILHANNIVHSNIKPENVLIGTDGILKLGDYPVLSNWTDLMKQLFCNNSERLCWEATEVKKRLSDHSAHKSDIQVGGMLLHYIICDGMHPFGSLTSPIGVDSNIRAGQYSVVTTDEEAKHLLSWMLPAEASIRKDTNICMTHPFFWSKKKQVQFMAAVGRQPEIRSGFRTAILEQINDTNQCLKMSDWREKIDSKILKVMEDFSAENQYDSSMAQLLKMVSDMTGMIDQSEDLKKYVGDVYNFIADRYSHCVLPIYDVVIKSALCLRPQLEDVMRMSSKSSNAF
ncbi:uncharacterized protein [Watersipora subatra]|uniref:uncharacterized protein n=1 Tax=Watersipora subatra TaxID=2589382 RepID=UPI00355B57DE